MNRGGDPEVNKFMDQFVGDNFIEGTAEVQKEHRVIGIWLLQLGLQGCSYSVPTLTSQNMS